MFYFIDDWWILNHIMWPIMSYLKSIEWKIQLKPCKMFWELKIFLKEICFFSCLFMFQQKNRFLFYGFFCVSQKNRIICSFQKYKSTFKLIWTHIYDDKRVNTVRFNNKNIILYKSHSSIRYDCVLCGKNLYKKIICFFSFNALPLPYTHSSHK